MGTGNGVSVDPGMFNRRHWSDNYQTQPIDYQIWGDAMDVLMFDENGIQTYKNGQNHATVSSKRHHSSH